MLLCQCDEVLEVPLFGLINKAVGMVGFLGLIAEFT